MAKGKKSFIAYADWKEIFDELPDAEAGILIKHIFSYVNDEHPQTDSILIRAVFANIKTTLKRDLDKWENQLEQRRGAGRKSAELKKTTQINEHENQRPLNFVERSLDSVNEMTRNSTDSVNVSVNDNVIVNDTVIDNTVPNHQHQSHETFAEKLFTQNGELDKQNLELQLNPRRLLTKKDCEEFNLHLFTEKKHHVHWSAYLSHLRNWLNTRPDNSKKQNYGKSNEQNPRLGRLDSKTIHSVLNRRKNSNPSQQDIGGEEAECTQVD